ncbi:MAG: LysE family transporter [Sideroxyarcus sp.]|nr:LysE family transporter [Sideroxyarcus sp.]
MLSIVISIACQFALNVLTPGASFVLTVRNALAHGRRAGYSVALGLAFADILLAVLAVAGLAAVLKTNGSAVLVLGYVGGVWIAATGLKMFQRARRTDFGIMVFDGLPKLALWSGMRLGASAGLSNPQSIIFFASVFVAGMVGEPSAGQAIGIVLTVAVSSIVVRCCIVRLVTLPVIREAYLARRRKIEPISGVALFSFGMKLAVKALLPWTVKVLAMLVSVHLL